tara:strand:+ start:71 stop:289 length:219 start_codon:yes stop_codon:yes gene_type:complete
MIAFPAVLKLLTPKVVKALLSYVFEKNDLDFKVEALEEEISELKKDSHPPIFSEIERDDIIKRIGKLEDRNA